MAVEAHLSLPTFTFWQSMLAILAGVAILTSCADAEGPKARDVNIPAPQAAETRRNAINERPDPIQYLPLGRDVLLPDAPDSEPLPSTVVGPFELRNESLAGALQLVMDGTDIPISFETTKSLDNTITVTHLKGPINEVVQQICGLADLYCSYENGVLNVKDSQIFTVSIPPIAATDQMTQLMNNVSGAIASITGSTPITDPSTRTIVYRASERTSEVARRYFQRLRQNTALIVFETYIWEVSLNSGNSAGINWSFFDRFGKFEIGTSVSGTPSEDLGTPISIGLPTTGSVDLTAGDVLKFISNYGAVKTISQPQITVLAGSEARLRVADTTNYLASVSRTTTDGGTSTTSTTTDSVDSGFTLVIGSNWDNATVYGNINILLQEVRSIDRFQASDEATIQLPTTSERELQTQVRIRPGDSLLIGGLVRERDNLDSQGPGMNEPIIPTQRTAQTDNVELVFLLRPRVIVFSSAQDLKTKSGNFPDVAKKADPALAAVPAVPVVSLPATTQTVAEKAPVPPVPPKEVIKEAPVPQALPERTPPAMAAPIEVVPPPAPPQSIVPPEPLAENETTTIEPAAAESTEAIMLPKAHRITDESAAPSEDKSLIPTVHRIQAQPPSSVEQSSSLSTEENNEEVK